MVKLPDGVDINNLIEDLRIFSWEAADVLLHYSRIIQKSNYKSNLVKFKGDKDPVTIADLEVNDLILKRLRQKYPNISWKYISEENTKNDFNNCDIDSDWVWMLDPLDGTKDFIQGSGNYAMHLALNYKNQPLIGVVLIPQKGELWVTNGENVWCEGRNHKKKISNPLVFKELSEMILVTSKNHSNLTLNNLIDAIKFKEVKTMGSIGCKIASIIRGESDIYICLSLPGMSSPKDWDFAAPETILKAAGGNITNLDNQVLKYGGTGKQEGIIIASNNKKSHKLICFQIKKIIEKNNLYPLSLN